MKRNSIWVAATVLAAAGTWAGAATAFGGNDTDPETAAEHYSRGMSLAEISVASQGKPGEIAPPCPDVDVVNELKAKGLIVGPCDPVPEAGNPIILSDETAGEEPEDSSQEACAGAFIRSTSPDGPTKIEGPCGPGAQILDVVTYVNESGTDCAKVTYVSAAGKSEVTDSVCVGDAKDRSKPSLIAEVK